MEKPELDRFDLEALRESKAIQRASKSCQRVARYRKPPNSPRIRQEKKAMVRVR